MEVAVGAGGLDVLAGRITAQCALESEIPVPDTRRAEAVLLCCPMLGVLESTAADGCVEFSGAITLSLLVRAEGEPCGFTASSAFTHRAELPAAHVGMDVAAQAQIIECHVRASGGKVLLSAVLEFSALVLGAPETAFLSEIRASAETETVRRTLPVARRTLLYEGSLRLREEMSVPNVQVVHAANAAVAIYDVQRQDGVLTAEGELYVSALTMSESGQLSCMQMTFPFTEGGRGDTMPRMWAEAEVESLYVGAADGDFGVVETEAVVRLRIYGLEQGEETVLLDAYDAAGAFCCARASVERILCQGAAQKRAAVREGLMIPERLPEALRPIGMNAVAAVTGVFEQNGLLGVDGMLLVTALYQCDGGMTHIFHEDLPVQVVTDTPYTADACVRLSVLSAELAGTGRQLDASVRLLAQATLFSAEICTGVTGVSAGVEAPGEKGIIIHLTEAGESLFDVGKRFLVSQQRIHALNPDRPELPDEGTPIVLVR